MANHYYGVNRGAGIDPNNVTVGTSTGSKDVELVVLDGVSGQNKTDVLKALDAIRAKLVTSDAPA